MRLIGLSIVFVFASVLSALADFVPYNGSEVAPNIAIIRVEDQGVRVELEIFVEDLALFSDILPDDWVSESASQRDAQADRLRRFAREGLSIRRADGTPLPVEVALIDPRLRFDRASPMAGQTDPLTGQVVPSPPSDPRVLYTELYYSFGDDRPDALTFVPPLDGETPAAIIGMLVYDRGVPVTEFRYLSAPATLRPAWEDPWYSRFDAKTLNRRAKDGTSTYLYLEPREVRHETLIRLRELAPWIGADLKTGGVLDVEQQARLSDAAAEFFASRNPVSIDGVATQPAKAFAEMLEMDNRGYQVIEEAVPLGVNGAFVGIILSFPVEVLPKSVTVNWDMFNDAIVNVPTTSTDMAGPFIGAVTPDDPEFVWTNHLLKYVDPQISPFPVSHAPTGIPWLSVAALLVSLVVMAVLVAMRGRRAMPALISFAAIGLLASILLSGRIAGVPGLSPSVPDAPTALSVVGATIDNLNTAALEVTPEDRSAALSTVASASALEAVSAELERGLAIRVPGGSLARVTDVYDVTVETVTPFEDRRGFSVLANWSVTAEAGHWGHRHRRVVSYRALAELVPEGGVWKLDGMTILEARTPDV